MDCKATVETGEYSRGGETRGYNQAQDHDMGIKEKYVPCGIVDEDTGQLYLNFGSSYKTSDFMVDSLEQWWKTLSTRESQQLDIIQIKVDNGPENSGRRTQFLKRMVEFAEQTQKSIQLLYFPPYHSKYNPIERCWGILEQHWNGALLRNVETMLAWAKTMTWKGLKPIINLNQKVYQKGISLSKKEIKEIEKRLERNPNLPQWDILIRPS
jgi:transposase